MDYEQFRHFADSWGLVYLFSVFVIMALFIWRPGSSAQYRHAARIAVDASEDGPNPPKTETKE